MQRFEPVSIDLLTRPNDLDRLGHVNNAVVLEYLEAGRWAWLEQHHFSQGMRILPVVARIEVNYRKEINPGTVKVTTQIEAREAAICYQVTFEQRVEILLNDQALVAAEAKVKVAFIDAEQRTLRSLQDFLDSHSSAISGGLTYASH
ncbi:MAG: acyl-CoA thioesterase [Thermosynechococcaceae cyanobacterium MS004]|nr:acyl-CoA thioesterase [Thermosynechococcaceae cyanobacterium MS004]